MHHRGYPPVAVCLLLAAAGCGGSGEELEDGLFTVEEMAKIKTLSPLPALKADTTNQYADNEMAAALGQRFFFEKGYSGPIKVADDGMNGGLGAVGEKGKVSCRSCHLGDWLIDTRSNPNQTSLAIDWFFRNSPTLVNVATYETQFGWTGFNDNLWGKNLIPAEFVMGTDRSGIVHFIYSKYRDQYNAIFDPDLDPAFDPMHKDASRFPATGTPLDPMGPWMGMAQADRDIVNRVYANFGKALQAYERKLISSNSPFDRYVAGNKDAISDSAKRGLKVFIGKGACVACHEGPTFSDEKFHNTGVPEIGMHVKADDAGRFDAVPIYLGWDFNTGGQFSDDKTINRTTGVMQTDDLKGAFRTKGLRSIAQTAPFMHTGHLKTLAEVVDFYNKGGGTMGFVGTKEAVMKPLNLTTAEAADLVAFLETLTGDPVPAALLMDTSGP